MSFVSLTGTRPKIVLWSALMASTRTGHVHVMKDGPEQPVTSSVTLSVELAPKTTKTYAYLAMEIR